MANDWMHQTVAQFETALFANGSLEVDGLPGPTLTNEIHPLFAINRWAQGYDQYTKYFYHRMQPALQLASLMITESCTLPWFTHVSFGQRKYDSTGKVHIAPTRHEHKPEGRHETRMRLEKLSRILIIMFIPRKYRKTNDGTSWGITWPHSSFPWFRYFSRSDLPHIPSKYYGPEYGKRDMAIITLNSDFQDFFYDGYQHFTPSMTYRVWFMFASTLVHELAHAYYYWLGRSPSERFHGKEPYWSKHDNDKESELGFSWESVTWGRIPNPINDTIRDCHALVSIKSEAFYYPAGRQKALRSLINHHGVKFTRIPLDELQHGYRSWLPSAAWRGNQWFVADRARPDMNYVSVIHAIPMWWIAHWFSGEEWNKKRRTWRQKNKYSPPPLGPTFMLIYERNTRGQCSLHVAVNQSLDPYLQDIKWQTAEMGLYDCEH
ncbi:hypothetical protein K469DRAFT_687915 [Zopfia rhizophila CBS 207.26]|uniref:Uncharacterized protein n=1 Tax=Zopfia rhizophila CBS 207.26 TaxID=1314779 RepID=A0A6A6E325_9PEZI|nr:hypothetical protein K469DRAFT_687915 [Zopfia rhizophila CBS 207.26]